MTSVTRKPSASQSRISTSSTGLSSRASDANRSVTAAALSPRDTKTGVSCLARISFVSAVIIRYLARKCLSGIHVFRLDGDVHGLNPWRGRGSLLLRGPIVRAGLTRPQCQLANGLIESCYGDAFAMSQAPLRSGILYAASPWGWCNGAGRDRVCQMLHGYRWLAPHDRS